MLTRTEVKNESDLDQDEYEACGVPADGGDRTVVERTGLHGSSLTIESGPLLFGCDKIPDPFTAEDPDLPFGGIWCAVRTDASTPACSTTPGWISARTRTASSRVSLGRAAAGDEVVVVSDAGRREVYEVAESLPVRVTTTEGVQAESSRASFDIEEYAADGSKLREYVLETAVAG